MARERILGVISVILFVATLSGCSKATTTPSAPPPSASPQIETDPNDPNPRWVVLQKPPAKVALVFVHGVTGDMIKTWTADNGKTFWDLVNQNEQLKGRTDEFVFGFPSYLLKSGSFNTQEAANRLHERIKYSGVLNYPAVVFVAHSMGGLVVLRELITNADIRKKVPVVMFFATPMEGSVIAAVGKEFSPNSALAEMTPAEGNTLLQLIDSEWKAIPDAERPKVRCAYENKPIGPTMIVPWSSATRYCDGATPAIEATHISIVKPARPDADAIVYLVNAINDYVLGKNLEAKLETPDFMPEGNHSVFVLSNAYGKQSARLVNAGGANLKFTLAEISDPALLVWPDDTPRSLDKESTINMSVALSRSASKKEYQFVLRTDVAPDRQVIVRVPDLAALNSQQAEAAATVAASIQATLKDPDNSARFKRAATDDKGIPSAIVEIARSEIEKQNPSLPVSAQWVLSADLLSSLNWPSLAAEALQNAEKASPAVTKLSGVQYLAALVSAQSGQSKIFDTGTPIITGTELSTWHGKQPLTDPQYLALGSDVATRMKEVPALKLFGLSLQGDVEKAKGNTQAARLNLEEAASIQPSPSVATRLQALDVASGGGVLNMKDLRLPAHGERPKFP